MREALETVGTVVTNLTYDTQMLMGWGKRNFNWEVSGGIQREVAPGMSAERSTTSAVPVMRGSTTTC